MATNKKVREIQFKLKDEDYQSFGEYRIKYTADGRKLVSRQRLTFIIVAIGVIALFWIFPISENVAKAVTVIMAVLGIAGAVFAEKMVLHQQRTAIEKSQSDLERVHPTQNKVRFGEEGFTAEAGGDVTEFAYSDVKLIDLTDDAIYVWMSDQMIMPVPIHAFRNESEMEEMYHWLIEKCPQAEGE